MGKITIKYNKITTLNNYYHLKILDNNNKLSHLPKDFFRLLLDSTARKIFLHVCIIIVIEKSTEEKGLNAYNHQSHSQNNTRT